MSTRKAPATQTKSATQTLENKNLNRPDEVRTLPKTRAEVVNIGGQTLMRLTLEPGWRWSEHVKPTVKTESCEVAHFGYCISGHLHVRMNDGTELEVRAGDAQIIPPGHDAWVIGDQPFIGLDYQGGDVYGKSTR